MVAVLNDAKVAFLEEWGMGEGEIERERENGRERVGQPHWAWHEGQW